jgi:hypothetical protein
MATGGARVQLLNDLFNIEPCIKVSCTAARLGPCKIPPDFVLHQANIVDCFETKGIRVSWTWL